MTARLAVDTALRIRTLPQTHTGCGAAWLARLSGGQEVGSSNLPSPTLEPGTFDEEGPGRRHCEFRDAGDS